jgi:hypothetical protein
MREGRVPGSAILRVANWSRFSFFSGMSPFKRPSGIWAASSAFVPPSMITSGSNRRAESWALLPAGRQHGYLLEGRNLTAALLNNDRLLGSRRPPPALIPICLRRETNLHKAEYTAAQAPHIAVSKKMSSLMKNSVKCRNFPQRYATGLRFGG